MSKWLKMGCGHLVALPFLFVALLITVNVGQDLLTGNVGNIDVADMGLSLTLLGVSGSVGGGLLVYLWRHVWPWERASPAGLIAAPFRKLATRMQRYAIQAAGGVEATGRHPFTGSPVVPDELLSPGQLEEGERPWETRDEWAQGRVASERGSVWEGKSWFEQNSLAMTALAGTISVGIGLFVLIGGGKIILAGIWSLPGISLFCNVGYRLARRSRFGETTFEMATVPGELGGHLCGTIHTGLSVADEPGRGVRVKLSCYRRHRLSGGEGGSSTTHTLLWRDEKQIECRQTSERNGLEVPVAFDLPGDVPASTPEATENRIMWVLRATAAVAGIDYSAVMEVPVFPVEPDASVPADRYTQYEKELGNAEVGDVSGPPVSDGIDAKRPARGTFEATVAAGRYPFQASFATLGVLVLGAISVPLLAWGLTMIIFVVPAVLSLIPLVMTVVVGLFACYLWTYDSHIRVDEQGVHLRSGMAGLKATTHVSCAAVGDLWLEGRYYPPRDTYDLFLARPADPKADSDGEPEGPNEVVAAQMLPNHREAEWIISQIEEAVAWHSPGG